MRFCPDQSGNCGVTAQLVQAAATEGPYALGGNAQPGADLGVWHPRVGYEQSEQLLVIGGHPEYAVDTLPFLPAQV